jgi:hypothetical protein
MVVAVVVVVSCSIREILVALNTHNLIRAAAVSAAAVVAVAIESAVH